RILEALASCLPLAAVVAKETAMRLKMNRLLLFLVLAPLFAPVVHPVRSHAQHVLPYDGATIFKTHIPHLSSQIGKSPEPSPQAISGRTCCACERDRKSTRLNSSHVAISYA